MSDDMRRRDYGRDGRPRDRRPGAGASKGAGAQGSRPAGKAGRPRPASRPARATSGTAARGGARRPPRRNDRHGHPLAWVLALVLVVGGLGWFALREVRGGLGSGGDDAPATPATTTPNPVIGRVTFPEGLRREEIAKILDEKTDISGAEYLRLTDTGTRGRELAGGKQDRTMEGFLFPATYDLTRGETAREIVDRQVQAYRNNTTGIDYAYARSKNLTPFDVLIIASMIEREVQVPEERPIVAGVIYNRLHHGMILGIDATVQYALGDWKTELTQSDLEIDSPYNTRKFAGLPPGPICNPGQASIQAAAAPRGQYLYYVARNDGTGRHFFARTDAEFQNYIARSRANAGG